MGEAGSKKRKRAGELPNKANKKVVLDVPPATATVCSVLRPKSFPPVIAVTPGITVPGGLLFHSYQQRDGEPKSKKTKQNKHGGAKELLLHAVGQRSLDYTATEEEPRGSNPLLNHFLAIYDPKTGRLEVIEAKKMVVRGQVRAKRVPSSSRDDNDAAPTFTERKTDLGQTFGTKKAKKVIRDKVLNAITPQQTLGDNTLAKLDDASRAMLDTVGAVTSTMATREDLQAAVDEAKPVPKANLEAEHIQDVYDPAAIIGADILNLVPVREWQEKARNREDIMFPSRFVVTRVNALATNDNDITRLRVLRYLGFVLLFFLKTKPGRQKGTRRLPTREELRELLAPAPEAVIESLRRKFSDAGTMSKFHQELLMTHCCAFACIIDNFEVETESLRYDLRLDQKTMKQYFHEIGARVKTTTDKAKGLTVNVARLTLPLSFPKQRQTAPRRK